MKTEEEKRKKENGNKYVNKDRITYTCIPVCIYIELHIPVYLYVLTFYLSPSVRF